ncbi:flagellar assembly protein FliW [Deltaproteobacteria bacterium OttesenSCG-928-M10]|nr:flagellar assembly protein FliW [Deltaproteobacteria bacterium OttesenSCG-928-M10]
MIKINTKRFGEMEFSEDSVVKVIGGLIGLSGYENFVIIRYQDDSPFYWLQCVDDPELALVMVSPLLFKPDYDPPIPLSLNQELDIQSPGDITVFVIVTIPAGNPQDMTANLLGPVVVNARSRRARQLVLDDRVYSHRYRVVKNEGSE